MTAKERVTIAPCGPEGAEVVHKLTQAAYRDYDRLDPPSGALRETVDVVRSDLVAGGGAIARRAARAVGCLRWRILDDGDLYVGRVAVLPRLQGQGIGRMLMAWAEAKAVRKHCPNVIVGVRVALPGNVAFYQQLGFEIVAERRHEGYETTTSFEMRKMVSTAKVSTSA